MMYRFLHITIVPEMAPPPPMVLQNRMNDLGRDWIAYNAFCWVLWTNKSIVTVAEMIMNDVGLGDQVLVVALDASEVPNGRLPQWAWDWFNRPRDPQSGDVQTPVLPAPEAKNLFDPALWTQPRLGGGKAQF